MFGNQFKEENISYRQGLENGFKDGIDTFLRELKEFRRYMKVKRRRYNVSTLSTSTFTDWHKCNCDFCIFDFKKINKTNERQTT